jgi:hypothetical protein
MSNKDEYGEAFNRHIINITRDMPDGSAVVLMVGYPDAEGKVTVGANIDRDGLVSILKESYEEFAAERDTEGESIPTENSPPQELSDEQKEANLIKNLAGLAKLVSESKVNHLTNAIRKMADGPPNDVDISLDPKESAEVLMYIKFLQESYTKSKATSEFNGLN